MAHRYVAAWFAGLTGGIAIAGTVVVRAVRREETLRPGYVRGRIRENRLPVLVASLIICSPVGLAAGLLFRNSLGLGSAVILGAASTLLATVTFLTTLMIGSTVRSPGEPVAPPSTR